MKNLLWLLPLLTIFAVACKSGNSSSEPQTDFITVEIDTTDSESAEDSPADSPDSAQTVPDGELMHDSDYGIYHYTFTVRSSLGLFSLVYHLPDRKLYFFNNPNEAGTPMQWFPFGEDVNYDEGYYAENPHATFNFIDYNFDGYKDIDILQIVGNSNTLADVYLFDPKTTTFVKNNLLSDQSSMQIDSVKKVISFRSNGGMAGGWYNAGVIEWKNGKAVITRQEEQTSAEGSEEIFVRTIQLLQANGQWKVASKVRIEQLSGPKEKQCLLEGEWTEFDKYPSLMFVEDKADVVRVDGRKGSCN